MRWKPNSDRRGWTGQGSFAAEHRAADFPDLFFQKAFDWALILLEPSMELHIGMSARIGRTLARKLDQSEEASAAGFLRCQGQVDYSLLDLPTMVCNVLI